MQETTQREPWLLASWFRTRPCVVLASTQRGKLGKYSISHEGAALDAQHSPASPDGAPGPALRACGELHNSHSQSPPSSSSGVELTCQGSRPEADTPTTVAVGKSGDKPERGRRARRRYGCHETCARTRVENGGVPWRPYAPSDWPGARRARSRSALRPWKRTSALRHHGGKGGVADCSDGPPIGWQSPEPAARPGPGAGPRS